MLDSDGRICGTRELEPSPGPVFSLIRGTASCTWAVRADVARDLAEALDGLAREEAPVSDFRVAPVHVERYMSLVEGTVDSGPSFVFPEAIAEPSGTVCVDDVALLDYHFSGWRASEIPECEPIVGVVEDGHAVSVCFCARRSDVAAEAGVETAVEFRGRGLGPRGLRLRGRWPCEPLAGFRCTARRGRTRPRWRSLASWGWWRSRVRGVFPRVWLIEACSSAQEQQKEIETCGQ